jgi:hypothetical protein
VEVMRKYILKVLVVFILLIGVFINFSNYSFALDYENGHFEKINSDLSIQGCPVKLKDGRILILDIDKNYIFDPKTNTFRETTRTPFGFSYISNGKIFPAVVLNNGKVLIIGKILDVPSLKFQNELQEPIKKALTQYEYKNNSKFSSLNEEKRNTIIVTLYKAYRKLPENEKEKLYLPIIAKDNNLLKQYNNYCKLREKSKHALLFNPNSETYETIEKLSFNGNYSTLYTPIVKSNNEILIFSDQGDIYEYNFVNSNFIKINSNQDIHNIEDIQRLNDNELFLILYRNRYCIYNLNTNKFSSIYELPNPFSYKITEILKLENNKLLLIGNRDNQKIYEYDTLNKEIKPVYTFLFKRALESYFPLRPIILDNKQIIVFGGLKNEYNPGLFNTSYKLSNKAEIINLQTYKSKLQSMHYAHAGRRNLILDDGRILIYGSKDNELYVPKGYKN